MHAMPELESIAPCRTLAGAGEGAGDRSDGSSPTPAGGTPAKAGGSPAFVADFSGGLPAAGGLIAPCAVHIASGSAKTTSSIAYSLQVEQLCCNSVISVPDPPADRARLLREV